MWHPVKSLYRRCVATIGAYTLQRMLDDGLPAFLHSPLAFLLTQDLQREDQLVVEKIEMLRTRMAERRDEYVAVYASPEPAETSNPSPARPTPGDLQTVALQTIANSVSVLPYWGTFLYRCASARHATTILELGGCAGISGCYLAAAPNCRTFITVEGSPTLATLAESNLRQIANNVVVINNLFDTALDELLPSCTDGFDLVHIDGQHEKRATLHYLERLVPHLHRGCLLAFDDIRWTTDMWQTWQLLCARKGMACTIDVGRYGLCVWDGETPSPRNYHFAKFTDLWRKGKPRT